MNTLFRQGRRIDATSSSLLSSIFSTLSVRHTSSRHAPVHKVSTRPPASSARHTMLRKNRGLYGSTHIQYGNSISDSHRKTARTFKPNVHTHTFVSPVLANEHITLKTTTRELRTIKKYGSLDAYLMQGGKGVQRDLGSRARALKKRMELAAEKKRARRAEKSGILKTLRLVKRAAADKSGSFEDGAACAPRSPSRPEGAESDVHNDSHLLNPATSGTTTTTTTTRTTMDTPVVNTVSFNHVAAAI